MYFQNDYCTAYTICLRYHGDENGSCYAGAGNGPVVTSDDLTHEVMMTSAWPLPASWILGLMWRSCSREAPQVRLAIYQYRFVVHVSNEGELVTGYARQALVTFFVTDLQNCSIMLNSGPVCSDKTQHITNSCLMTLILRLITLHS